MLSAGPDHSERRVPAPPRPNFEDYLATKAEQGCLFLGIAACTVLLALIVFTVGALTDLRGLNVAASVILFMGLAVGIFVGYDVNYRVVRMRERAKERTEQR